MTNSNGFPPISEPEKANPDNERIEGDQLSPAERFWKRILRFGLGEVVLRAGTGLVSIALVLFAVWVMSKFFLKSQKNVEIANEQTPAVESIPTLPVLGKVQPIAENSGGVIREAQIHTTRPSQPRNEIFDYTIESGDTLFGIAEKFGLKPESLLWSNRHILGDNPHNIFPGVTILIPPIDGAIYKWNTGDGLNGVSKFYNVTPDVIIDWPGNKLDRATLGDLSLPNIPDGTFVFVPGGEGEFTDWLPVFSRDNPTQASIMGPGFCGVINEGPIGTGSFIWPTTDTYLSGYDYTPATNHFGIDIHGSIGNAIFAVDDGVVVYSGWNNYGYGNLIVIDHGNGWQSVYAHLDTMAKVCGENVFQGDVIAGLGTTGNSSGPHLHFELRNDKYGKVNPWDFLQ